MRILTGLFLLFVAGLMATPAEAAPRQWLQLESDHFIFYTDVDEETARKTVIDLEKFRYTVGKITGLDLSVDYSPKLKLFAFKTDKGYLDDIGPRGTGGFYIPQPEGAVSVLSLEKGEKVWILGGIQTIFHEYVHHIIHQYSSLNYPRWYDEGFAEYLGTMEFDGKTAIIGKPAVNRFPALKSVPDWLRMKEIFRIKGEYVNIVRRKHRRSQMYAQGWLLAHFMQNSDKYRVAIAEFLHGINEPGVDSEELFKKTFKTSFSKFDKEVKKYWYDRDLPSGAIDMNSHMPDFAVTKFQVLSGQEAKIVLDEGRLLSGRFDIDSPSWKRRKGGAAKRFQAALDADVRPTQMNIYLARLAVLDRKWEKAASYIDAALEIEPKNASALTIKGDVILSAVERSERSKALLKSAKKLYAKAIRSDRTYVPALLSYVDIALHDGQKVKASTIKIMGSIRYLSPDLRSAKRMEVRLLSKAGHFDDAIAKLQTMIDWAPSEGTRKFLNGMMKTVVTAESVAASAQAQASAENAEADKKT
ncbi:MAG: hypothetical protein JKY60_14250 [Kordiimonadaceae bacterium]|nr:hypothetical protein [Kordiimonadaceae bacterium]